MFYKLLVKVKNKKLFGNYLTEQNKKLNKSLQTNVTKKKKNNYWFFLFLWIKVLKLKGKKDKIYIRIGFKLFIILTKIV